MKITQKICWVIVSMLLLCTVVSADPIIDALRKPGHVALMRHAIAPGTGDPDNFNLGDCETQRNLSADGRVQAEAIGGFLREQGLGKVSIYSSQWCRCLETARLLNFGEVKELPFLNSFFQNWDDEQSSTFALQDWIANSLALSTPTILVTHQVNITALTGVFPASGDIVVVRLDSGGNVQTIGTFNLPAVH